MYNSIIFAIVLAGVLCLVNGQSCTTPDTNPGQCKSIFDCQPLLDIANNQFRTNDQTNFLRLSKCGYNGNVPLVCCAIERPTRVPGECSTPDGSTGRCINVNSCEQVAPLLEPPVSQQTINYIRSLKCPGSDHFSVCCAQNATPTKVPDAGSCAATVTANPPDPRSGCCGLDSRFGDKIFGGQETGIDEYPWLVLIEYFKGEDVKTMCGGSLISGRYVLTAGHCVAGRILELGTPQKVRLGEHDALNEGGDCVDVVGGGRDCTDGAIRVRIQRTIPHPQYDPLHPLKRNDIALIRLQELAPYTDFIRPICLPSSDLTLSPPANFTLFAAGWGAISERKSSSSVKLHVDLPFVTQERCQPSYTPFQVQLWDKQLCAGGQKGKDSCKGDSGGPLMFENGKVFEEIGVVSYGNLYCGTEGFPAIYTKVFDYLDWIRSNIQS